MKERSLDCLNGRDLRWILWTPCMYHHGKITIEYLIRQDIFWSWCWTYHSQQSGAGEGLFYVYNTIVQISEEGFNSYLPTTASVLLLMLFWIKEIFMITEQFLLVRRCWMLTNDTCWTLRILAGVAGVVFIHAKVKTKIWASNRVKHSQILLASSAQSVTCWDSPGFIEF